MIRILIIGSYNLNDNNATSITINRLFTSIDFSNTINIICCDDNNVIENKNTLVLRNNYIYFYNIKKIVKIYINKNKTKHNTNYINNIYYRNNIFSIFDILNYKKNKRLIDFIDTNKPDVIYTPLGSLRIMELCLYISKKYSIPIVPHFMDDWPSTLYTYELSSIIQKLKLKYLLNKIIKKSKIVFTISDYMSQEYEKKYHVSCISLMNTVPIDTSKKIEHNPPSIENTYNFCYYGGLHLNRWKSLLLLCNTIKSLSNELKININIYSKKEEWDKISNKFTSFPFIKFAGYFNSEIAYSLLKKEDILIHLESFDEEVVKYTKLSISTKIPEYLSLNKPIIAIGPSNIASINYLKTNNCAIVMDNSEEISMVEKISLIRDCKYLQMISNNAYNLYLTRHTVERNNEALIMCFRNVINKTK